MSSAAQDRDEPLPTEPDPRLVQYVEHGEPGRWIVVLPILLAVLVAVELIVGRKPW